MTLEQRLYEAFRAGRGIRLTADEVDKLLRLDDAIQTRIVNRSLSDRGEEPNGTTDSQFGRIPFSKLGE